MKKGLLFLVLSFTILACATKSDYDGLYIADKQIMGVTRAWLLKGDVLTIYAAGDVEAVRCEQLDGAIELESKEKYSLDPNGGIVVPTGNVNLTMRKISKQLEFRPGELEKIIEDNTPVEFKR